MGFLQIQNVPVDFYLNFLRYAFSADGFGDIMRQAFGKKKQDS